MRVPLIARGTAKVLEVSLRVATTSSGRERSTKSASEAVPAATGVALEEHPDDRALFISVKPRYANAILEGTKTVELRRTRPNLPDGSLVILYSSTPTRAVVGWAQLTAVRVGTPLEIWNKYG